MNRLALAVLAFVLAAPLVPSDEPQTKPSLPPATKRAIDFDKDIKPILAAACVSCHGPASQRGGLRLDSRDEVLKGGNHGAVIKAGDLESRLLILVAGLDGEKRMPPKSKEPLTQEQVGHLRAWIEQGATWPKDSGTIAAVVKSDHWAFQSVKRPDVPQVKNRAWVRNDIDAFVLARLEKEKIEPSAEADRLTLMRRVYLDLIGLPPTIDEIDEYLKDTRPDAYERLVDKLLASPHYGERWGRHWLDLARYADSDGFEKDSGRPYAWRYRNWVIEALNHDLPYDEFTIEQLAGDLLPDATTEQKVATGFHRNTLTNKEGGVDAEQFRVEQVVDRVNTTAKVFLGVTMNCCQCHDHKFDPFSQREYYQLFAFFNSDVEVNIPAPVPGDEDRVRKEMVGHEAKLKEVQKAVEEYRAKKLPAALAKWEKELKEDERKKLPPAVREALDVEPEQRDDKQKKVIADHYAKSDAALTKLTKAVADHQKNVPTVTQAQAMAPGKTRKTNVMIRGDFLRPGVEVAPATPGALPPLKADKPTRLDLAKWLVEPENPLTSRVLVNWMWQKYFGRGLVSTLEDFGTQGEKPSHPELLDWLASEVQRRKWSLKEMHKLIVTSATYRQSAKTRPELAQRDPLNVLLARQTRQRLDAEILRDEALAASGLLTRTVGGPSVRPPQPPGISELTYANSVKWFESTGPDRYRRGLYIWFQRTSPFPMLMTFDAPDSNVCTVRREKSNTPLQALTLLNDTVFVECAQALGRRLHAEKGAVEDRIKVGFRLCVTRQPTERELAILSKLYDGLKAECKAKPEQAAKLLGKEKPPGDVAEAAAWAAVARTLLNLDEFVNRE
jgi:mono/diheme cytochrome c family protein